jgi:hypothetical protein
LLQIEGEILVSNDFIKPDKKQKILANTGYLDLVGVPKEEKSQLPKESLFA